jgi:hypothetical protein
MDQSIRVKHLYLVSIAFLGIILIGIVLYVGVVMGKKADVITDAQVMLYKRCVNLQMKTQPEKLEYCESIINAR